MALANVIESFFVYLGFEVGEEELNEWKDKLHDLENVTALVGGACLAAAAGVATLVNEFAETYGEMEEFSERSQVNIEDLQELGFAASVSGSSLQAVETTVQGLNEKLGEAALGIGRGAMIFKRLGLSARDANGDIKTSSDFLAELSGRMQRLSLPEATAMGRRLGIDPSLILLMRRGADNLASLTAEAREYGVVSQEQAEQAVQLHNAWTRLQFLLRATGNVIAVQLLPGMLRIANALRGWLMQNRQIIASGLVTFFKVVAAVLGTVWDWTERLLHVVTSLVAWIWQWHAAGYALVGVLIAATTAGFIEMVQRAVGWVANLAAKVWELDLAETAQLLLIGALVAGIGLLIDDLYNYYKGNESLIGQLRERYPHAAGIAIGVVGLLTAALGLMTAGAIASGVAAVAAFVSSAVAAAAAVPEFLAASVALFGVDIPAGLLLLAILAIVAAVAALGLAAYELWTHWDQVLGWMHARWDSLADKVRGFGDLLRGAVSEVGSVLGLDTGAGGASLALGASQGTSGYSAPAVPLGGVLGRPGATSVVTTHSTRIEAPITVVSSDPDRAGDAVHDRLQDLHRSAVTRDGQSGVGH